MKTNIALAVALALGCSAAVAADKARSPEGAPPTGQSQNLFERLDKNKDGYVTKEEARNLPADTKLDFSKLDANNDGRISRAEMDTGMPGDSQKRGMSDGSPKGQQPGVAGGGTGVSEDTKKQRNVSDGAPQGKHPDPGAAGRTGSGDSGQPEQEKKERSTTDGTPKGQEKRSQ
ncbi:MAG TPA: EF-hand domain-containing protein [Burkholderiales bacterium]|nr:EF-hand domain-containing protein [Burkholderiales bacterium]